MINTTIQIQLLDQNSGLLDVLGDVAFPLNFGVADIRDISKRTGAFSKTLSLAGTKNNARLLNNYFDINIEDGTFDINKKQKCNVLQNGVVILSEGVFQLISVNKTQNNLTEDDEVTYNAEIRDSAADFFTLINDSKLEDLEIVHSPITYNASGIVGSWSNTSDDHYKFIVPWFNNSVVPFNACHPGIYAKTFWDLIHANSGYTYEWRDLSAPDIQFDRLILPYNGDPALLMPKSFIDSKTMEVSITGLNQEVTKNTWVRDPNSLLNNMEYQLLLGPTASSDPSGEWNPNWPNNQFTPSVSLTPPFRLDANLDVDFEYIVRNLEAQPISAALASNGNRPTIQVPLAIVNTTKQMIAAGQVTSARLQFAQIQTTDRVELVSSDRGEIAFITNATGPAGPLIRSLPFAVGDTVIASGSGSYLLQPSAFDSGDILELRVFNDCEVATQNFYLGIGFTQATNLQLIVRIKSARLRISPNGSQGFYLGTPLDLNDYIPKNIKQSDFIKSIATMFNLYCEPDPNRNNNLIWKRRDQFYDEGDVIDWTEKLDRSTEQEVIFLPELTTKSVRFTWRDDQSDPAAKAYKDNTKKVYGQLRYTYGNEWVKGEDVKELIFAPTLNQSTSWGADLPFFVDPFKPSSSLRCLLDNGLFPLNGGGDIVIEDGPYSLTNQQVLQYPHFGHFNHPTTPTYDINFGKSDYYLSRVTPTDNNLFWTNWVRTIQNINTGKMLVASFWLTEADMNLFRLSSRIRIDNGYYYINKIRDYNAAAPQLTKVELITVEQAAPLGTYSGSQVTPYTPKDFIDSIVGEVVESGRNITDSIITKGESKRRTALSSSIIPENAGNLVILGNRNFISPGFEGVVIGDNIATQESGVYVGDWKLSGEGVQFTGIRIIDGGYNVVVNLNKTSGPIAVDGGKEVVRNLNAIKGPAFLDGGRKL